MTLTYYTSSADTNIEKEYLCSVVLREVNEYRDTSFSNLVFLTGRSPAAIRHIIEVELPKRGHSFVYKSEFCLCEPDPDDEIQISNQHVYIWVYLAS